MSRELETKSWDQKGPARTMSVADALGDQTLLERAQAADTEALSSLFKRYAPLVRSLCRRIIGDPDEAEDLVQDLFLFVQTPRAKFDPSKSSARSWIVQMTYHRALERRRYLSTRHFYRTSSFEEEAEHMVGNATGEQDYSAEAVFGRNGLQKLLGELSEDQRQTLRLYFFEGYTLAEISEKLGEPLGNVRHHYYRAIDKLRKQMFGRNVRRSRT